jgi:Do/DeqQ family serine protease
MKLVTLSAAVVAMALTLTSCRTGLLEDSSADGAPKGPSLPVSVDGVRTSYADVVEKASPAVVRIDAERKAGAEADQFPFGDDFFRQMVPQRRQSRPQPERGMGSGVIVTADGTILTNHHVVAESSKITVTTQDNRAFEARIVGSDPPSDLAVLKIEAEGLPSLTLGDSDAVRVGDMVLAIGNPLGIGQTVTAGIISAKGRQTGISDGAFEDFLQTDAPINRGNSGGALVNLQGELIGINSQILSPSGGNIGIGFAIPSNMAKSVMGQLLEGGKVRRGMLGINIQNLTEDAARSLGIEGSRGVLVSDVRSGSAGERAGLKRGDVITAVNGERVDSGNVLRNKVAASLPGTDVTLTVVRDGKEMQLTAKLDEFDRASAAEPSSGGQSPAQSGKLGLTLRPLTPELARDSGTPAGTSGLLVVETEPDGAAAAAGISPGDVILEINRKQVATLESVGPAIALSGAKPVLILVMSGGRTAYVTARPRVG